MSRAACLGLLLAQALFAATGRAAEKAPQWIVATAPAFRTAIEPLCEHRRAQGLRVHVVVTTDVLTAAQIRNYNAEPLKQRIHELCRQSAGPNYVLLVGATHAVGPGLPALAEQIGIPALKGTIGRMEGQPSDNRYGCVSVPRLAAREAGGAPNNGIDLLPTVAVGRFPARSVDEARQMVQKTIEFEHDRAPAAWHNRLTILAGNPGGSSAIERRFAEWFVQSVAGTRFAQLDARWTGRCVIHAAGSPFTVPDDPLGQVSLRYLEEGQLFACYLGHSHAQGLWSTGTGFLDREDWARLKIPRGAGVFFTCGCFGCQLDGPDGEGYGLAAIRNSAGPVAVIGAHGESYAAMGQLALDGLLQCLDGSSRAEAGSSGGLTPGDAQGASPPDRLADYWLASQAGIARGPIDAFTFWLYDQADGSQGQIPLDRQRLEHLEMWMLLGDPALRLPIIPQTIHLSTNSKTAVPGESLTITGSVPAEFASGIVRLTLERPLGSKPLGLVPLPEDAAAARQVVLANHDRANATVLKAREIPVREGSFEWSLKLPAELPWPRLNVRAAAATDNAASHGTLALPVRK